ncbi:Xylose ABC transporter, periplasmic xylose-binding protein XylF [Caballeronia sordidicola]|jgi:ribose transport system substrate-binding protein|uniref:Xylose ABC transporter, periplasmic xylose-binding protein XylF n=2 Tax=Caballeronia sordidicola TaxID=196367 RepID=A0A226X1T4_CABSO|nr:Xylose ABC transporter, periplasmic xylose-binding protein XylF [Caballeronia sordidicola]
MMLKQKSLVVLALALFTSVAGARDLKSIGVTLGSLGNPYFVALTQGVEKEAKSINPTVKVIAVSADYDFAKQVNQIDNFIAAGTDLILINAVDPQVIGAAVKKAQAAGVIVIAVDARADQVDATVQTDNVQAGEIACAYIADKLHEKGNVIIQNGPQLSGVTDRVNGCKSVFAKHPDIKILSDDQNGKASREGGLAVMQGLLTRFSKIDAMFAINDPQAVGSDLAIKQFGRRGLFITSVDGSPEVDAALRSGNSSIEASASQNPFAIGQQAVKVGYDIMNGKRPKSSVQLVPSTLVTKANVSSYKGWTIQP